MEAQISYAPVIAGTMTWGSWGKKLHLRDKIALMKHCLKIGITTFDHADIYGGYTNEAEFGEALDKSGIPRKQIQLISKCGIQYVCDARNNKTKHYEYAKDYIIWSVEQSLKNLRTDYLDLLLLHRPSPLMHVHEIAEAIESLKARGKIRQFGVSNFAPAQIAMLETAVPVSANQVEFSLTAPAVMYDGTLDDCVTHRRMVMAWSPLGSIFKETGERTGRIRTALGEMENKYNATASQILLAWLIKHPSGVYPVVGTTDPDRLSDSVEALKINLELQDWFLLLEASQGHKVP